LRNSDWKALAEELGLSGASTVKRVEELAELVSRASEDIAPQIAAMAGDPTRVIERITHNVRKRCRRIQVHARG
jgi:serine/threonine-protein kinase HipA